MIEAIKSLIKNKEDIKREEISTVKLLVPFHFEMKDGKCVDESKQELYDFLNEREDVAAAEPETETLNDSEPLGNDEYYVD